MTHALSQIATAVGAQFGGVTPAQISSRRRPRSTSRARAVTLYVARSELGMSYSELGAQVNVSLAAAYEAVCRVAEAIVSADPQILAAIAAGERVATELNEELAQLRAMGGE